MASEVLKILEAPAEDEENQTLKYNSKVAYEACILLKSLIKPRQEEQLDIVSKFESRLIFEIKNLDKNIYSHPDCEDFSLLQVPEDNQSLIVMLLSTIRELSMRDTT